MPARQNKYFLPGDGIRREVITADICRYLGNDALVKPGQYEVRRWRDDRSVARVAVWNADALDVADDVRSGPRRILGDGVPCTHFGTPAIFMLALVTLEDG